VDTASLISPPLVGPFEAELHLSQGPASNSYRYESVRSHLCHSGPAFRFFMLSFLFTPSSEVVSPPPLPSIVLDLEFTAPKKSLPATLPKPESPSLDRLSSVSDLRLFDPDPKEPFVRTLSFFLPCSCRIIFPLSSFPELKHRFIPSRAQHPLQIARLLPPMSCRFDLGQPAQNTPSQLLSHPPAFTPCPSPPFPLTRELFPLLFSPSFWKNSRLPLSIFCLLTLRLRPPVRFQELS